MVFRKSQLMSYLNAALVDLPTPSNINYMWNFGSLLGVCLLIQIISGLFLSFHYCSDMNMAFSCISRIVRDCNSGWLIRSIHANGASMFFILIYLHIGRGIYYHSYYKIKTWSMGVMILLVLMATAFMGYVLPWGQMSFWGATVITNLLSAIPYIGEMLTYWVWGGYSVGGVTLMRFFSLHFLMPFILMLMVVMHIIFLHEDGSSNPLGVSSNIDKVPFHPYYTYKDILGIMILLMVFMYVVLIKPYMFMDPENFIPANMMVTPPHIQPEWYFLFAYAILRSIPNKLGGVIGLVMSIMILFLLPWLSKNYYMNSSFYIMNKILFWIFVNIFIMLTFLGSCPVESPYILLSQIYTIMYFIYFLVRPYIF
uniref:Cytochrome b n=1 Tax=Varroa destructor TaxID=109461 RepID=A0A5S9EQL7_VARDE|nr:cytochrome b [Varroa destructor]